MYEENLNLDDKQIVTYCSYCKDPIYEGEGMIRINRKYYHYDPNNQLNSCYFPEEQEDEE